MRIRDETFSFRKPLWKRALSIIAKILAMPFLIVWHFVRLTMLLILVKIQPLLMLLTVFCLIPTGAFAYHHDWNSAAQAGALFLILGTITSGMCYLLNRQDPDEIWRLSMSSRATYDDSHRRVIYQQQEPPHHWRYFGEF